jgi:aspartate aminotransferase-like enzyme
MKRGAMPSILVGVVLLAVAVIAEAQQPKKVSRIGYLGPFTPSASAALLEAFRQGLRELGYEEGRNISSITAGRREPPIGSQLSPPS